MGNAFIAKFFHLQHVNMVGRSAYLDGVGAHGSIEEESTLRREPVVGDHTGQAREVLGVVLDAQQVRQEAPKLHQGVLALEEQSRKSNNIIEIIEIL